MQLLAKPRKIQQRVGFCTKVPQNCQCKIKQVYSSDLNASKISVNSKHLQEPSFCTCFLTSLKKLPEFSIWFSWPLCKCPQHTWHLSPTGAALPQQRTALHMVFPFLRVYTRNLSEPHRNCFCIESWDCFSAFLCPCVGVFLACQHNKLKHFWLHMLFSVLAIAMNNLLTSANTRVFKQKYKKPPCWSRRSLFPQLSGNGADQEHHTGWMKRWSRRYRLQSLQFLGGGLAIHCCFLDKN